MNLFKRKGRIKVSRSIDPDEIFLDSENLPGFNKHQLEGRIEKPISNKTIFLVGSIFLIIGLVFTAKVWALQISNGEDYRLQSEQNTLRHSIIFASRGTIYDLNRNPLVWDEPMIDNQDFSKREYIDRKGFSNLLGYVAYPKKDDSGFYYETTVEGIDGIEYYYNDLLQGENGKQIVETNALSEIVKGGVIDVPERGQDLYLTIDIDVQENLRNSLAEVIEDKEFRGGGGVIMDVITGDVLALVSFPEYDSEILSLGEDEEKINSFINDPQNPFLNRVTSGLYTPGSIVKPFIGLAALAENIISPNKKILSTGSIEVPNPYDPENPTIFNDWKVHGWVNMQEAIADSSNVYFYEIGGGFEDQKGLGISRIEEYLSQFGFGEGFTTREFQGPSGTIPTPEWKERVFDDVWRIGDTYFTSIGQYGFQVTPLQAVRGVAALANDGILIEPRIVSDSTASTNIKRQIDIDSNSFEVIRSGMRDAVLDGSVRSLNFSNISIAAKTGTAEIGVSKERVNSWVTGFFPYENPRYSFAIVLEAGPRENLVASVSAAKKFFEWLSVEKPNYTY